jgi:hypothetical protein
VPFKVGWSAENHGFVFLSFTVPEPLHCCDICFHCSYLYNYYNWSWTLFNKCWNFIWFSTFHTENFKNSERGDEGERRPKEKVTFWITPLSINHLIAY